MKNVIYIHVVTPNSKLKEILSVGLEDYKNHGP